jgi:hypothetical protein
MAGIDKPQRKDTGQSINPITFSLGLSFVAIVSAPILGVGARIAKEAFEWGWGFLWW